MPVSIQPFISFIFVSLFIVWHFFVLSPCSRGKLAICVCCSERTPRFYSLSSFMVPICTILKVLILVYMQNIPVLQQKRVKKIKIKKNVTASHLYFLNIVLLLYYVLQSPKRKKRKKKTFEINALFIKWCWTVFGSQLCVHFGNCSPFFFLTLGTCSLLNMYI